jgi:hypothetical protein
MTVTALGTCFVIKKRELYPAVKDAKVQASLISVFILTIVRSLWRDHPLHTKSQCMVAGM